MALVFLATVPCSSSDADGPPADFGRLVQGLQCVSDPTQTYSLYLPSTYDPSKSWPVLLVFDPRGRSVVAAELFLGAAEEFGWIVVSSNDTRSDTDMEVNRRAVNALWPEIHNRYPIDTRRVYAAGFSGTAFLALRIGAETGGLAGALLAGGRYFEEQVAGVDFPVFGTVGALDFNNREMRMLHARLTDDGIRNRLEIFEGGHAWMPVDLARSGVVWMNLQAMRDGSMPPDADLIGRAYRADLDAADAMAATGNLLGASRKFDAMVSDYQGLTDVSEASGRAAALNEDPRLRKNRSQEERLDGFEARYIQQMQGVFRTFIETDPALPPSQLARQLDLDDLARRADRGGAEGQAADRLLSTVLTATSFYLSRDLLAAGRPNHAASVLAVAAEIDPQNPVIWYNRSCALARAGRQMAALDALETAIDNGFDDLDLISGDGDLESIRGNDRYRELVKRIQMDQRDPR